MKIAVSAMNNSIDAPINPRFGRCQYFMIVDTDTMEVKAVSNDALGAMSGAGIQAAQIIVSNSVQLVLTGNVGPNAFNVLSAAGVRILTGIRGTVSQVIEQYKRGELEEIRGPTVGGHNGMGSKRGRN
jgi:predicted Fe-Mo cluster-binding NifX family protein